MMLVRAHLAALAALLPLMAGCDDVATPDDGRPPTSREFPKADRPVSPIISTRWSNEEARDRVNEAEDIMDHAGIRPGMTVADIGAGEGYYTVRLAKRVGEDGRVLAQDILPEVIDALGRRVNRENWENVSVKLGSSDDPKLPEKSFDRILMVHMYHEITEPYAFLWRLYPALKDKGEVIVVEPNRQTQDHGTPPALLKCEFAAIGFRVIEVIPRPSAGGYMARFARSIGRVPPERIVPCQVKR